MYGRLSPNARTADREIVTTRVIDAPRELVYAAWVQPEHVAQWWGPRGFTNTIKEMNVTTGGVWRVVMHGPDGTDYPNKMVFSKIVANERLEYARGGDDDTDHVHFHTVVTFDALDGNKTRVTMRAIFATVDERNRTAAEYGAIEGGKQTLDRLGEHLVTMASGVNR